MQIIIDICLTLIINLTIMIVENDEEDKKYKTVIKNRELIIG